MSARRDGFQLEALTGISGGIWEVPPGVTSIGHTPGSTVALPGSDAFEPHCRIDRRKKGCWVETESGSREIFLNGLPVTAKKRLDPGDILHVGEVCFRLREGEARLPAPLFVNGRPATRFAIEGPMVVGSHPGCEVVLASPDIAPHHLKLEGGRGGVYASAVDGATPCLVNRQPFQRHQLLFGDQLQVGGFHFQFDGRSLELLPGEGGASLTAEELTVLVRGRRLIERVSLRIEGNEFAGIIGPTGAGKSTLLKALSGLRLADTGRVLLNGNDLRTNLELYRREFGWVPQEDIVHRELTVAQGLAFAARLRLPRETPDRELARLVVSTAKQLGLESSLETPVGRLSGGEIKKTSVAAELLCRPHVLFLDEPTSGLDPGAEARLMAMLRQLADGGCTVVCTTHLMRSLHLLDRLVVLSEGNLVFSGPPSQALEFFGVRDYAAIFDRLEERKAAEWREASQAMYPPQFLAEGSLPRREVISRRRETRFQPWLVFERQAVAWTSDLRNGLILLGQPALIGLLLFWAVRGTLDDSALKLFFISVATLWFGCSNGAQEIIGEIAIYRRERLAGLQRISYFSAKWLFFGLLTLVQSLGLWLLVRTLGSGLGGSALWQVAGLTAMALLSSGVGLAISALSRSATQAVVLVPLVIIPQIILSGFTVPASMMAPSVRAAGEAVPSFQLQRIMDISLLWEKPIDAAVLQNHLQAFQNLTLIQPLKIGQSFANPDAGFVALLVQVGWLLATAVFTLIMLARKEREY